MTEPKQSNEAPNGQSQLTEVLERRIAELAEWFSDNPNTADIADGVRCIVRDAILAERIACVMACEVTMTDALGGNKEYNIGREMGAIVCANKIRMRSNAALTGERSESELKAQLCKEA
jgi:hypothetical protein